MPLVKSATRDLIKSVASKRINQIDGKHVDRHSDPDSEFDLVLWYGFVAGVHLQEECTFMEGRSILFGKGAVVIVYC